MGLEIVGKELWVSVQFLGRIERFSADRDIEHLGTIPLPPTVSPFGFPLPLLPVDIAFSADGSEGYAPTFHDPANGFPDGFVVIDVTGAGSCLVAGVSNTGEASPACVTAQVTSPLPPDLPEPPADPNLGPGAAEIEVAGTGEIDLDDQHRTAQ